MNNEQIKCSLCFKKVDLAGKRLFPTTDHRYTFTDAVGDWYECVECNKTMTSAPEGVKLALRKTKGDQ